MPMVCTCISDARDETMVAIPRAQYEALMGVAQASAELEMDVKKDANPGSWFKAMAEMFEKLADLHAAGIQLSKGQGQ